MYSESTLNISNKIISTEDLIEILDMMNEKYTQLKKLYEAEKARNAIMPYDQRVWTFEDIRSKFSIEIKFHDKTSINFDNYNNFKSIFNNRIEEIQRITVTFRLTYWKRDKNVEDKLYDQMLDVTIYEDNMSFSVKLSDDDKKIDDLYYFIKDKIASAPYRNDNVISKRKSIYRTVGFALGFIPAFIITTLFLFIPLMRNVCSNGYIVYPLINSILIYIFGKTLSSTVLGGYYKPIEPDLRFASIDFKNGSSTYKYNMDKYLNEGEVLIGKNINNNECRKKILEYKDKFKKWIPYELGILLIMSVIVIFL